MRRAGLYWLAAITLGIWTPDARAQWPEVNAKLTSKQIMIRKAVALPAQVTFNTVGAKGPEGGISDADQIAQSFYAAVTSELTLRGVEVGPNPVEQAKDDAARYAVADLQANYDNAAVQIRRRPGRVTKGQYTLGDRVAEFEPGATADVLVFIRGEGVLFTLGRRVLIPSGIASPPPFRGEIALVDAKTGEVLVFVRFARGPDPRVKTDERLAQNIRQALHDVPLPLAPPKS